MPTAWVDFVEAYNHELRLLGSGLRVRVSDIPWQAGDLIVVDPHGQILGPIPASIGPVECAAIEGLIRTAQKHAAAGTAAAGPEASILAGDQGRPG